MAVGAAESEGGDVDVAARVVGVTHLTVVEGVKGRLLQVRVQLPEVVNGNADQRLAHQGGGDETRHGSTALQVPSVRLVGEDHQLGWPLLLDLVSSHSANLDGVAQGGAGAVATPDHGLDGRNLGFLDGLLNDVSLCQAVRRSQGGGPAVLVDHGRSPDGVLLLVLSTLQRDGRATITAHVTAGRGIEGQAAANGRVHCVGRAAQPTAGVQAQVESARNVELQLVDGPVQKCELGQVGGTEGGRAGGVCHEVGATQVEDEAESVGDNGLHVDAAISLRALGDAVPVVLVEAHGATTMVWRAVGDLLRDPHLEEVLGTRLQHHALHGVHDPGLAQDDLEELVVKQLHTLHHRLMLSGALPGLKFLLDRIVVVLVVPAGVGNLHAGVAAPVEPASVGEGLIVVAHEARRHVHDLNLVTHGARRALSGEEEAGVALPVEQGQLRGLLQEGCRERERLLVAPALVVEGLRPEDQDRVWLRLDLDAILLAGQGRRRALTGGLQDHL
mmetsp:Transcript_87536/g.271050  ORF Transcript_87536/g.271050 Transcript_87536/m.271050 type:complete len:501 (+) Transcript_87536:715-2217(+)